MSKLHDDLMETAEHLLAQPARFEGAKFRRAASTAYYAVFHRLAALCATHVGRLKTDSEEFQKLYRYIDHGPTRKALKSSAEFGNSLGRPFELLQEARNLADYSGPLTRETELTDARGRFTRSKAREFVTLAKDMLGFINSLDREAGRRLAILLLVENKRR
ncbi:MAG: hypothetical protein ACLPN5_19255 [Roseiarcus sp.]